MKKFLLILLTGIFLSSTAFAQYVDKPYDFPVSVKYQTQNAPADLQLRKVVVDYNDIVYVLTNHGLWRVFEDVLAKDLLYRSLADLKPVDITVQEGTGYLYYLYNDQFLTNAHAGAVYAHFDKGSYDRIAMNSNDEILLVGDKKAALYHNKIKISDVDVPRGDCLNLYVYKTQFYLLTEDNLYRLDDKKWKTVYSGKNLTAAAFVKDEIALGTTNGYFKINGETGAVTKELDAKLPVPAITTMMAKGYELWFGSEAGAFTPNGEKYRYYASKRWLDNDSVVDLATDSRGDVYVLSPTGLNKIHYRKMTLAEKTAEIERDLRQYHISYGFTRPLHYKKAGDLTTAVTVDTDNDGLWTTFYLGSLCYKYAVTGEESARRYAWESFETFERLLSINQLTGFPSRTFERKGFKMSDIDRWRQSPEADWEWKGHTSTDEYIAYLYITTVMDEFIAKTPEEHKRIANFIDAIMTHIIQNDYYFVDIDGEPTLWGRWNPEFVNAYPRHIFDRRLNSTHLIAGLQLAYALTGKEIFKTEAYHMMEDYGYLENMKISMKELHEDTTFVYRWRDHAFTMGDSWNHSDDEMAFLTYYVSYKYAFTQELRDVYKEAIIDHWELERPEKSALWNVLPYASVGVMDYDSVIWHLKEYPIDMDRYTIKNSNRKDLEYLPRNFRNQRIAEVLSPNERPMNRHNSNAFSIDSGGGGMSRLAGDEYLLPYWMARYYHVIK